VDLLNIWLSLAAVPAAVLAQAIWAAVAELEAIEQAILI
jgi:hypothetical protein